MQIRDALRVGSIAFSAQFFSTTQGVLQVKQQIEDELVLRPRAHSTSVC